MNAAMTITALEAEQAHLAGLLEAIQRCVCRTLQFAARLNPQFVW